MAFVTRSIKNTWLYPTAMLALIAGLWAFAHADSLFLGIWTFFLVQALFVAIPTASGRQPKGSADANAGPDHFEQAYRTAETALRRLSTHHSR